MFVDRLPPSTGPTVSVFAQTCFQRDYIVTQKNENSKLSYRLFHREQLHSGPPLHARRCFPDADLWAQQFWQNKHFTAYALRALGVQQSFPFFPKTCTRTNTRLFCGTLPKTSIPLLVTKSLRLPARKSSLSKSCRWTTKKSLSLMTWCARATKTASSIISSMGGTVIAASFTSLRPSTRCRKTSAITAATFAFSGSFPAKTNSSATRLALTATCWIALPTKNFLSFITTNHVNL